MDLLITFNVPGMEPRQISGVDSYNSDHRFLECYKMVIDPTSGGSGYQLIIAFNSDIVRSFEEVA